MCIGRVFARANVSGGPETKDKKEMYESTSQSGVMSVMIERVVAAALLLQ
jgi:hypothetical protein